MKRFLLGHKALRSVLVSWVAGHYNIPYPFEAYLETTLDDNGDVQIVVVVKQQTKTNVIPFRKKR